MDQIWPKKMKKRLVLVSEILKVLVKYLVLLSTRTFSACFMSLLLVDYIWPFNDSSFVYWSLILPAFEYQNIKINTLTLVSVIRENPLDLDKLYMALVCGTYSYSNNFKCIQASLTEGFIEFPLNFNVGYTLENYCLLLLFF